MVAQSIIIKHTPQICRILGSCLPWTPDTYENRTVTGQVLVDAIFGIQNNEPPELATKFAHHQASQNHKGVRNFQAKKSYLCRTSTEYNFKFHF